MNHEAILIEYCPAIGGFLTLQAKESTLPIIRRYYKASKNRIAFPKIKQQFFSIQRTRDNTYMTKEQQFWDWFKENEAQFFFLNQIDSEIEKEKLLDELLKQLHSFCDQLFFEVGGFPNEKQDLIITADGNTEYFDKVESLVKQAPLLDYWNIIAFKPAIENNTIEYKGIQLNSKTIFFDPLENRTSEKIGLRLYIDNYNPNNKTAFLTATYLLLDNILGEKSNAQDIGYVDIDKLSSTAQREELIELNKLPRYIQWKKSKGQ